MPHTKILEYPIIVIGAGAGGLVIAVGAAKAKKKVLLIEKGNYGGDCTNFGCIPSKSLIAASHAAHYIKRADKWGILGSDNAVDTNGALERARNIVEEIRHQEEPEALAKLGIDTLTGVASFFDPHTINVRLDDGDVKVKGKNIIIATGSSPVIPSIKGLQECPYTTNETVFNYPSIPKRLAIIGGGPVGAELAQAFQRLGSQVTLIQHELHLLQREDEDAQCIVENVFREEGLELKMNSEPIEVTYQNEVFTIRLLNKEYGNEESIEADQLLVSAGRKPNMGELNLDGIGIKLNQRGIEVDSYGRTNYKHIFAVGDVVGRAMYTHIAENEARTVLKNLLFPWPLWSKLDTSQGIPHVTFTDPEVASVGMTEGEAITHFGKNKVAIYMVPFTEVDRAITTSRTEGFVKIVTKKWSSKMLGACIVAPRAGEMLPQITTAMRGGIPLRKLATLIHPYPTYNLAIRKAADQWLSKTIFPSVLRLIGK